ncbi:tripartite tricarboxylate transporter substrate-binding protein, partial [Acidovorax sp.]|uniref:Bug family tripartite tricarboxylate transporter substrate binding protein n=1 Tax=Acidovorax sp. TaxID=1872122 RepID=UPI0025C593F8
LASMPDVPTVAESGVNGLVDFQVQSWQAIFVPASTPAPIISRLHDEIRKILAQPDMQNRLKGFGMEPADLNTTQIAAFQKAEVEKWAQVIKAANIKVD